MSSPAYLTASKTAGGRRGRVPGHQGRLAQSAAGTSPDGGAVHQPPRPAQRRGAARIGGPGVQRGGRGAVRRIRGDDLPGSRGRHQRPAAPAGLLRLRPWAQCPKRQDRPEPPPVGSRGKNPEHPPAQRSCVGCQPGVARKSSGLPSRPRNQVRAFSPSLGTKYPPSCRISVGRPRLATRRPTSW